MGHSDAWGEQRSFERHCNNASRPSGSHMVERLADHLQLTAAQKATLDDMHAAYLKSREESRSLCSTKPDFGTVPGRMAYDEATLKIRLDGLKSIRAKMDTFYSSLNDDQKAKFNQGYRRHGASWRHPDDR